MLKFARKTTLLIALFSLWMMLGLREPPTAQAQTTADCGRFYLKKNKKTGRMECVNKKKSRRRSRVSTSGIQRGQRAVGQILGQAATISQQQDLTDDDRRRVNELLTEATQRVKEIQRQTKELQQEQRTRSKALSSEQDRRSRQQENTARALVRQQQTLTQQLLTQQRQFTKEVTGR